MIPVSFLRLCCPTGTDACIVQRPTADQPFIAGLLDPACNNKLEPNIPAERLYDKADDGLDPGNSWKGFYVLL